MAHVYQPETDPRVRWYHRGGFTTIAVISLVLGAISLLAIGLGMVFGQPDLAAGYVPFPSVVGLLFGVLGTLGPWKWTAAGGIALNVISLTLAIVLGGLAGA